MEDPLSLSFFNYIIKSCNDYHSILAISTRISINGHSLSERGTCMWPIFVSVTIHQGKGLYWQVLGLSELCKEKRVGQQRWLRISSTGNLNQISMSTEKGVYQKMQKLSGLLPTVLFQGHWATERNKQSYFWEFHLVGGRPVHQRGGEGYLIYPCVGRNSPTPHTLTLFKTNITDFPNLFKDSAYYCYCADVLCISRCSDFLSPMLNNTGIFLHGLKLSGESRS